MDHRLPAATILLLLIAFTTAAEGSQPHDADLTSLVAQQDRQIRNAVLLTLIPIVVAFTFFVFIFYRAKREAFFKQQEVEFRLQLSELEMKALRAQINPHFIFNCLNSIRHYMMANNGAMASDYLIKFSQLTRYVLEASSFKTIPLAEDLQALTMYLELEQLRLNRSFQFAIDNRIEAAETVYIPPMMIQPFVENSIWHGISGRASAGMISITATLQNNVAVFVIEDNGVRTNARLVELEFPGIKKTSMGMALIHDRLAVLRRLFRTKAEFIIEERKHDTPPSDGTRVILTLPFEKD